MSHELRAIETFYKGYRFRSRLEARWAVFFDALGIGWEYEPEAFDLDGVGYLPDFRLTGHFEGLGRQVYAEVKAPRAPFPKAAAFAQLIAPIVCLGGPPTSSWHYVNFGSPEKVPPNLPLLIHVLGDDDPYFVGEAVLLFAKRGGALRWISHEHYGFWEPPPDKTLLPAVAAARSAQFDKVYSAEQSLRA